MQKTFATISALTFLFLLSVLTTMADDVCEPCDNCYPLDIGCTAGDNCVVGDDYNMSWTSPLKMPTQINRPAIPADGSNGSYYTGAEEYYPECPVLFNV